MIVNPSQLFTSPACNACGTVHNHNHFGFLKYLSMYNVGRKYIGYMNVQPVGIHMISDTMVLRSMSTFGNLCEMIVNPKQLFTGLVRNALYSTSGFLESL